MALVGSVLGCAGVAATCWLQTSVVGWVTNLVALAILLILAVVYDRPGTRLVRAPFALVYPLCAAVGLASVVRVGDLGWPHISSTAMGVVVFCGVLLAYVLAGLREPGGDDVREPLTAPFASGRWVVRVGSTSALNHHVAVRAQMGAVDLVAVRRDGARADGVCPDRLEDYEAFGQAVVSPCDGVVVEAVDGEPDQMPQRIRSAPPPGNYVRIDTGGLIVHLAHLRCGSLRVAVGDRVVTGQPLGEVGSSGRSAEPHLHIHAERAGSGLRLRFADHPNRRLRPGTVVGARADGPRS